ncbi:MAG: DMT family transporter [Deltaproteobacteria bacterium]|jgi:drug/metabolite transporter (DMT)-like permease|nr:DMT family transporter [Deltaproteobacteria bacterium]
MKGILILLAVAVVWGGAYPTIRWAVVQMDSMAFTGIKFLVSAAALLPLAMRKSGALPKNYRGSPPGRFFWVWAGLVTGSLIALESLFLYAGMVSTTAGKAAFLANMDIVIVPIMALFIGRMPGLHIWGGLALGVSGLWLLSDPEPGGTWFTIGDLMVLVSAVFSAAHVVVTGRYANRVELYRFVTVQLAATGFICLGIAAARGVLPSLHVFWVTLPCALYGILSLSWGIAGQTAAQRHLRASEVTLLLLLEAVFAAIFGMIFLDEDMTLVMWAGAALMVAAAALSQSRDFREEERVCAPAPDSGTSWMDARGPGDGRGVGDGVEPGTAAEQVKVVEPGTAEEPLKAVDLKKA